MGLSEQFGPDEEAHVKREAVRYLGYGKNMPDEATLQLIEEAVSEIKVAAAPRSIYRRFPLAMEENQIRVSGLTMESKNLAKNLTGCHEVIFYAATLGVGVDRLLNKNLKLHISKAAVIQATAAAYLEEYIDAEQRHIEAELAKEGLYVRPRFSPGYGDLALNVQGEFLQLLEATKRIGITLSEGDIMLPEKSVTAIMGLSQTDSHCLLAGCEICENVNCAFRRCE